MISAEFELGSNHLDNVPLAQFLQAGPLVDATLNKDKLSIGAKQLTKDTENV